ncbi:PAS domain S-box protein [bacterium]|nr:PAS domain S-box protein [bacterium]
MTRQTRVITLITIMVLVALVITLSAERILYRHALTNELSRCLDTARDVAELAEVLARQLKSQPPANSAQDWEEQLLRQLASAARPMQPGNTSRLVVCRLAGENLELVGLKHGAGTAERTTIPWASAPQPYKRAVAGEAGTLQTEDEAGHRIIAGYAPLDKLNIGVVASIELAEVRAPYTRSRIFIAFGAVALTLLGILIANFIMPAYRHASELEDRLRDLIISNTDIIWETDGQQALTYCSDNSSQILGWAPRELLGKKLHEVFCIKPECPVARQLSGLTGRSEPLTNLETYTHTRDGQPVYLQLSGVPVLNRQQELQGYRGIAKNITDRRQAEEARRRLNDELERRVQERTAELADANYLLKQEVAERKRIEERARYMALFAELSPTPVVRFDTTGRILMANPAAVEILSLRSNDTRGLGEILEDFTGLDFAQCIQEGAKLNITAGIRRRFYTFNIRGIPELGFGQIYASDVTELVTARVEAESANRAKSQFLANMSHELRTPLTVINGFSEVLLETAGFQPEDQQHIYLERIRKNGEHLLVLINDLLDLAKIEAGRMELEYTRVDLTNLLREAAEHMSTHVGRRGLELFVDVPPAPVVIEADRIRIKQVILNLISNAIKFTRIGSISVWLNSSPSWVRISVKDTGIGISPENQRRLFYPFEQVHDKQKISEPGTGLGLALCQEIVEAHHGKIHVVSELGIGSDFIVELPVNNHHE